MLEWWQTVLLNTVLSIIVAFGVGLYIRYNIKPKNEIVFEHNRNEEIIRIFSNLNMFDLHFRFFFEDLEKMGEITLEQEHIIPEPKFQPLPDG